VKPTHCKGQDSTTYQPPAAMSTDRLHRSRAPTNEDLKGAAGPALLHRLAAMAGFVFRDISGIDLGIDAQIELFAERKAQGSVLLQIKGTAQPRIDSDSCEIVNVHAPEVVLQYWLSLKAPVALIQVGLEEVVLYPKCLAYVATWVTAVDASWEALVPKGKAIGWERKAENAESGEESRRHVLRLSNPESLDDVRRFREWLLSVRGRGSSPHLAQRQSQRALDAAEFDVARSLVAPWHRQKEPWALIQMSRIARREGKWDPRRTEDVLKGIATDPDNVARSNALLEIGYSYLVAAMSQQVDEWAGAVSSTSQSAWQTAIEYLDRWLQEPLGDRENEYERTEYLLYAYQVALAMNVAGARSELDRVLQDWTEQTQPPSKQTDAVLYGNLRQALLTGEREAATKWMGHVWALFEGKTNETPRENRRSSQDFAAALLWRAWTLALEGDPGDRKTFEAAETAVGGVLWYPELRFWIEVARHAFPARFGKNS
jgi:Domain of unknown function (DUF4365)